MDQSPALSLKQEVGGASVVSGRGLSPPECRPAAAAGAPGAPGGRLSPAASPPDRKTQSCDFRGDEVSKSCSELKSSHLPFDPVTFIWQQEEIKDDLTWWKLAAALLRTLTSGSPHRTENDG